MKRGTPDHPKVKALALKLNLRRYHVVGILESLWHFAANYAKRGDIGKWTDGEIAAALDWDGDAGELIAALTECRLLDRCKKHRLVIHDWAEHADQTVHRSQDVHVNGFAELESITDDEMLADASSQLGNASQPKPCQSHKPKPSGRKRAAAGVNGGTVWGEWVEANRSAVRKDPSPTGQDTKAAKELAGLLPDVAERGRILRAYLSDADPWLGRQGHPLRLLLGRLDGYRNGTAGPPAADPGDPDGAMIEAVARQVRANNAGGGQ